MKKFILKIAIYLSFSLAILILIEVLLFLDKSAFSNKARYLKNEKENIEIVILGTSHNQNAINPNLFNKTTTINLAYGSQDLNLDLLLLKKVASQCPKLKTVIIELSYHSLEFTNPKNYWRNNLYTRFYNIYPEGNIRYNIFNYSIFLSNPTFFIDYYIKNSAERNNYLIDVKGFIINDFDGRFLENNFDTLQIKKTDLIAQNKFNYRDNIALVKNKKIIRSIIELTNKNKLNLIFISPPVYKTATQHYLNEKLEERSILLKNYPNIIFLNYEQDKNFTVEDFKNDDHLNTTGANKFTKLLIEELTKLNLY